MLHEIRLHGRGGQGTVSAAALLAHAAFTDGFESQAFPKFGSERRGAPVESSVRISDTAIRSHSQIYSPDVIVIQDLSLLYSEPVLRGLKDHGLILLNAEHLPDFKITKTRNVRWIAVPANRIGSSHLGHPLPNTVLLGVLAAATEDWITLAALEKSIEYYLSGKGNSIVKANQKALLSGYRWLQPQQEVSV